jgi:hypothetical protein
MPLDLSLSDMPWFGQPANPTAAIESGVRVGATLSSLAKQKREREMQEVRFAQEQHEFKQKDEAFNHEQAMQRCPSDAGAGVSERGAQEQGHPDRTSDRVGDRQRGGHDQVSDVVIPDDNGQQIRRSGLARRTFQHAFQQSKVVAEPADAISFRDDEDGRQVYENNQAKKIEREAKAKELPADAQSVQYKAQQRAIAADPNADPAARAEAQLFVDEDDKRRVRSGETITTFGPDGKPIANHRERWSRREGSGRSGGVDAYEHHEDAAGSSEWAEAPCCH